MAELLDFFLQNAHIYIIILIIGLIIYIPIFKKFTVSIADPAFMAIIGSLFANSIPFFLFYGGYCDFSHFIFFLFSEIVFWWGVWRGCKSNVSFSPCKNKYGLQYFSALYRVFFLLFIVTHLLTYLMVGIPLFMSSRLEAYSNSAGLGSLSYFTGFSIYYVLFYSFYKIFCCKKYSYIFIVVLVLVVDILSGSRGAIFNIIFTYFVFSYFYLKKNPKISIKLYPVLLAFPLIVISLHLKTSDDEHGSLFHLIYRIISYGDIYWEAYPDNVIDAIQYKSPFVSFFSPILGPLRIVDYKQIEPAIGFLVHWEVWPSKEGELAGPNARIPVFSWVYLRWFGLFLSFLFGYLLGGLISKIKSYFANSLLGVCLYGYLYITAWSICTDPAYFIGQMLALIINFLLVLLLITCYWRILNKRYS